MFAIFEGRLGGGICGAGGGKVGGSGRVGCHDSVAGISACERRGIKRGW